MSWDFKNLKSVSTPVSFGERKPFTKRYAKGPLNGISLYWLSGMGTALQVCPISIRPLETHIFVL